MRSPLSMFAPVRGPLQRRGASLRAVSLIAIAVVLAHAVLLRHARLSAPGPEGDARPRVVALQVRALHPAAAPALPTATPLALPAAEPKPRVVPVRVSRPPVPNAADSTSMAPPLAAAPPRAEAIAVVDEAPSPSQRVESANDQMSDAMVADAARPGEAIPTYPTSIPQPFTQRYELRRGALVGRADLLWRPAGEAYEARLSASLANVNWLEWISRGEFDAAGLAPLRFTDQRRGRAAQAANFQRRVAGLAPTISYSGPAVRHELHAGAQDRLSWIVQLVAIAQGGGVALSRGASIAMFVTGARGDGDVWVFTVAGTEPTETVNGNVDAVKLVREPRKPYDTHAEIWLDPAHGHLPARLRLSTLPRGDSLEFVLQETSNPRP